MAGGHGFHRTLASDMILRQLGHVPQIAACDSTLETNCGEAGRSAIIAMDVSRISYDEHSLIHILCTKTVLYVRACVRACASMPFPKLRFDA